MIQVKDAKAEARKKRAMLQQKRQQEQKEMAEKRRRDAERRRLETERRIKENRQKKAAAAQMEQKKTLATHSKGMEHKNLNVAKKMHVVDKEKARALARKRLEESKRLEAKKRRQREEQEKAKMSARAQVSEKPAAPLRAEDHFAGPDEDDKTSSSKTDDDAGHEILEDASSSSSEESSEEEEEEEQRSRSKKKIPEWAKPKNLMKALKRQEGVEPGSKKMDPDRIFAPVTTCDLSEIFPTRIRKRFKKRFSTGNWSKDTVSEAELAIYRRQMGFAT